MTFTLVLNTWFSNLEWHLFSILNTYSRWFSFTDDDWLRFQRRDVNFGTGGGFGTSSAGSDICQRCRKRSTFFFFPKWNQKQTDRQTDRGRERERERKKEREKERETFKLAYEEACDRNNFSPATHIREIRHNCQMKLLTLSNRQNQSVVIHSTGGYITLLRQK